MLLVVIYGGVCFSLGALTAPMWPWLLRRVRRQLRRGRRQAWSDYLGDAEASSGKRR